MKKVIGILLVSACSTMDGGTSGGGGGGGAWKPMPLVDDGSVTRADNDLVTGIYFASPDDGYVVTQGSMGSFGDGGAVFKTSGSEVKSLAFSGKDGGPSELGGVDFVGVDPTPSGVVAFAYSADVVASTDHGATFSIVKDGNLAGIEPALALRQSANGTTIVRDTGVVSTTSSAPGPSASFTDVWAPNGDPPTPNPVPDNMCQGGPRGTGAPVTRASVYVSSDRQTIAYTSAPNFDPQICISHDGGSSFMPVVLTVPDAATSYPPTGVLFANATTAITWWASQSQPGSAYIQRSTDGGATWTSIPLPADVASHELELPGGFFAPDGAHGWLVGYDHDSSHALLLTTTDGGASWAAATVDSEHKLYSGFALDASHVWLGGEAGTLLAGQ
jgi:photosystem II stability/assembly factor-like uncharacterized protein